MVFSSSAVRISPARSDGKGIKLLKDKREEVFESVPFPVFPQPSHERPPFFHLLNQNGSGLDDPEIICTRRYEIEQSVLLLSVFEFNRVKRHATLSKVLSQQNVNHIVLVMTINLGFIDIFRNWVRSCEVYNIDPRSWSLIFALDSESGRQVEELGFTVFVDETSYGKQPKEAVKEFGNKKFLRLMFAKTAIVQDVLQLGYDVLFQDVDLVWKKNPLDYLLQPSRRGFDAQFMYDGPNALYEPLHANSGFFFLRNTPESRMFWNMVFKSYDKILYYCSQQKVVNIILLSRFFRGLKLDILSEKDFANGHLFCENQPFRLPKDPYVIHCSWTMNVQHKIEKYKNANLWYL